MEFAPGFKIHKGSVSEISTGLTGNLNTDWIFDDVKAFLIFDNIKKYNVFKNVNSFVVMLKINRGKKEKEKKKGHSLL